MKRLKLDTVIQVFEKEELEASEKELLDRALAACDLAHAPYSHFQVGVSLLLNNGQIVDGANQENAAYPMCICAEPVALSNAKVNYPGAIIQMMAIRVKSKKNHISEPAAPCGACRQIISEYEQRQQAPIAILLQGETGVVYKTEGIASLLPLSFDASFLD